jgi:hypothetical protein
MYGKGHSEIGIHAVDADNVYMIGNVFDRIDIPLLQDEKCRGRICSWRDGINEI